MKTFKAENDSLKAELEQAKQSALENKALADNPEFKEMQARIADYENRLIVTNLEESHAYQTAIAEPLHAIITEAQEFAETHNIESDALLDAMTSDNDELLSELLVDVPERQRSRVYNMIDAAQPLAAKREELVANAEEALKEAQQLDEERAQAEIRQRASERKESATQVANTLKSKIPFLEKIEELDMDAIAEIGGETDPALVDPVNGAYQVMSSKVLPKMVGYILNREAELQGEIDSLTEKLAAYADATPSTGGGSSDDTPASKNISAGEDFLSAVASQLGG